MRQRAERRAIRFLRPSGSRKVAQRPLVEPGKLTQQRINEQFPGDIDAYDRLPPALRWMVRYTPLEVSATQVEKAFLAFKSDEDDFIDVSRRLYQRHRDNWTIESYGPTHPQIGEPIMEF